MKAQGENSLGFAKLKWEREREALALMLLALYIGNNNLQATPWWGRISQATTLTPVGPLQG
jgi:hypothetical protein